MSIEELLRENARLKAALAQRDTQVAEERLRRMAAEAKVKDLLRRLYGPSSEKIDAGQHLLALECLEADRQMAEASQPADEVAAEPKPPRKKRGPRRPLPENLPVERVVHDLPEDQKRDAVTGEPLVKIREEVTEEIDYRPSQFVRVQHVVPVYAPADKSGSPVQAKLNRVIPGSIAGTGLLSHLLVARFVDHLPYYRQEQIAARQGVVLERQKISQWYDSPAFRANILAGDVIIAIEDTQAESMQDLNDKLEQRAGMECKLTVLQGGKELVIPVKLNPLPPQTPAEPAQAH